MITGSRGLFLIFLGCPRGFCHYFSLMFVREKKNKSGIISVQVIDKSTGKYKVKMTIGSSASSGRIKKLVEKGREWIASQQDNLSLDFNKSKEQAESVLNSICEINVYGVEMLLGKIFDEIGFNKINSPLFKPQC